MTITSGVHWTEVHGSLVYEGSVPLTYSGVWPSSDSSLFNVPAVIASACSDAIQTDGCDILRLFGDLDDVLMAQLSILGDSVGQGVGTLYLRNQGEMREHGRFWAMHLSGAVRLSLKQIWIQCLKRRKI
jgi:hypothetical protein